MTEKQAGLSAIVMAYARAYQARPANALDGYPARRADEGRFRPTRSIRRPGSHRTAPGGKP